MAATSTRIEIVQKALKLAGRSAELNQLGRELLNDLLKSIALKAKYPALRKVGAEQSLPAGSSTVALPSDFGAGSDHLVFGTERSSMYEKTPDEFFDAGGLRASSTTGRPTIYMIDKEAGLFRFNATADQAYGFIPVYFKLPAAIPLDASGDSQKPWFDDDLTLTQGLIELIYQYTGDAREFQQGTKFKQDLAEVRRGIVPMGGGTSRITLSKSRFR